MANPTHTLSQLQTAYALGYKHGSQFHEPLAPELVAEAVDQINTGEN